MTNYKTFEDDKKSIDDKISMLERYILAEDKQAFFDTLVFNSDTYLYMKLNDEINKGKDPREHLQGPLATYFDDVENSLKLEILFKDLANKIPVEKDEEKRKQLIERFNKEFLTLGFFHNKPAEVKKSEGITSTNDVTYSNSIKPEDFAKWTLTQSFQRYFDTPANQTPNIGQFKKSSYAYFDLAKLLEKNQTHFLQVLRELPHYLNITNLADIIQAYQKKRQKDYPGSAFQLPAQVFTKMTLEQMESLEKKIPELLKDYNFVSNLYSKKFEGANREGPVTERLAKLKTIIEWCQRLPSEHNGLEHDVTKEAVSLALANKIFDQDLYNRVLNKPASVGYYLSESKREELKKWVMNSGNWTSIHNFKRGMWLSDEDILKEYLTEAFKTRDYKEFISTYREDWLKKIYYTCKLQQGDKPSNITEVFTEIELNNLRDKKELFVLPETKLQFKEGDQAKVVLQMKNIKDLRVSIYEIDTFSYYKKLGQKLNPKMSLAGVIPSWTFKTEFSHPPIVQFKESFVLDQITKAKRGVFFVEFVGDGLSTRAMIRKGNLNLVRDSGNEAHLFYILDENNAICKGKEAKLHFNQQVYEADADGKITVPYMNQTISTSAIISFENYSEICTLNLERTDIVFDAALIFNEEMIESGKTAQFIIQPKLFAFNRLISINQFKDAKIIVWSKNLQDVRHSKIIEDVKFQENEDFVIDYQIPSKTTEISIEIKGSVYDKVSEKDIPLSILRKININRRDTTELYYNIHLKQEKDNYRIRLVGKNGETYPGCQITVTLTSTYLTNAEVYILETDAQGEINLGALPGINTISAALRSGPSKALGINRSWIINTLERYKNFPEDFDIAEGEDLCIPAYGPTLTREDYSLYRTDPVFDSIFEDKFSSIQQEGELLYLSGLKEGYYVFNYHRLPDGKKITLRVNKGKRWDVSPNYLLKDSQMVRMMNQANYLTYKELKVDEKELSFKIMSNELETVKVHVLAYNYFPDHVKDIVASLKGNCVTEKSEIMSFATNFNEYYSEKELSDELQYAIERKNRPTFMGNTLEKPSGLLKRHFKQKTRADRETLAYEKDYAKEYTTKSDALLNRALASTRHSRSGAVGTFNLELSNSFLSDRGSVVANAEVDADGHVAVDIAKFAAFSTALLVIEDKNNCLCEILNLGTKEPAKKDLRLEVSRDANKVYLHERTVHRIKEGSKLNLKDPNNTEMTSIDNISYLMEVLKLLAGNRTIDEWDFLKRWSSLDSEDILKKYDKYISNELHLFAYFKDKEFFEMVIKAHIRNKNEKCFIDHFLLDNKQELLKYLDPVNIHKLNIIEKSLLIIALKDTNRAECIKIFELLKLYLEKVPEDQKNYNAMFDSVLRSEQSKEKQGDDKDARNTIGTSFTGGVSRIQAGQGAAGVMPRHTPANVRFSQPSESSSIKENRGGVQSFRTMGVTDEFAERQYYYNDSFGLDVTKFWVDFIDHTLNKPNEPFLSENFILSARGNVEMLAVLSVMDVPFERVDNESVTDQSGLTLTAKQNSVIFCKEIKERNDEKMDLDMIISQQFFDVYEPTERARDGSTKLKKVTEFVAGKLYASRISITNLSETDHEITLIAEIPQGSLPVKSQDFLKSTVMVVNQLTTKTHEFQFYFPTPGSFTCYPAAVTKNGCLVASSQIQKALTVYKELPKKELKTMKDILSVGKTEDILDFMRTQNIVDPNVFNFSDIHWLLRDYSFYSEVIKILEERFIFDEITYSYSVYHGDIPRMRQYLKKHFEGRRITVRELDVYYIKNGLFDIDDFKFLEYYPLINPRVHDIGEYKHNILNRDFMNTYITFLKYLLDKGPLTSRDYFYLCVYFLLQDRVDDVLAIFPKINKAELNTELLIQCDYLTAYLDLYLDYPAFKKARDLCTRYLTYPIYTWRNKFIDLANQIAEFDGQIEISKIATEENTDKKKKKEAQKQIVFESSVVENKIKVTSRFAENFKICYYEVDLEVMFTQDPFLETDSDTFSYIKPNFSAVHTLPPSEDITTTILPVPAQLEGKNLYARLICQDIVRTVTVFPSNIETLIIENHGLIKVSSPDHKPLSKVYVKCFSKNNSSQVKFYKDGYTDMRGTFDYASLNLESQKGISKFALLVSSKENGAKLLQVNPPSELQKAEGEAMKLMADTWVKKQQEQAFDDEDDFIGGATEECKPKGEYKMKKNKYWK
mgnify:FL=1